MKELSRYGVIIYNKDSRFGYGISIEFGNRNIFNKDILTCLIDVDIH